MKKFLVGFLLGILVVGVSVSALAASSNALPISGPMTIKVDPIHIQVNGVTFQPTDVNGKAVPVFAYNGTTYAPLRALAEAYGLTVGYDAETNMATVVDPTSNFVTPTTAESDVGSDSFSFDYSYEEFKGLWEGLAATDITRLFFSVNDTTTLSWLNSAPQELVEKYVMAFTVEYPGVSHSEFLLHTGEILYTVEPNDSLVQANVA